MSNTIRKSGFGEITTAKYDTQLRSNVARELSLARTTRKRLNTTSLDDIATYIDLLETALLNHHMPKPENKDVLQQLKRHSGLDIAAEAYAWDMIRAEDV